MILQKCEINESDQKSNLKIDPNTYLCITNEILINFKTFDSVEVQ